MTEKGLLVCTLRRGFDCIFIIETVQEKEPSNVV